MSNDRNDRPAVGPKPLSAVSMLKLLVAQGAGAKFEMQPEHIRAFETALEALAFKEAVGELMAGGRPRPHAHAHHERSAPREPFNPATQARGPAMDRKERPARPPQPARPARAEQPARPPKAEQPPRPASGAGAIWTAEEEQALKEGWSAGRSAQELAAQSGRSAGACFARLIKLGSVSDGVEARAARHLVRLQKEVSAANQARWMELGAAEGFLDQPAPAPAAPVAAPAPAETAADQPSAQA